MATLLVPHLGYARAATVAKTALAEGSSIIDVVVRLGFASREATEAMLFQSPGDVSVLLQQ